MRVLWVSARLFSDQEEKQTGVWLKSLAVQLADSGKMVLGNVSTSTDISGFQAIPFRNISQWALPARKFKRNGYPSNDSFELFEQITKEFKPDIIQVWGSENPLRLLPFDKRLPGIKIFCLQGVLSSIGPVLLSGLSFIDIMSTIGIREIIFNNNLFQQKRRFERFNILEEKMVLKSTAVIIQSEWTKSQLIPIHTEIKFYRTNISLRTQFMNSDKWHLFEHESPIIYSAAIGYSLKGLHMLIKAIAIIKQTIPDVKLRLAGAVGRLDFLGVGYFRFIVRQIKKLKLEKNVIFLGALNADEIVIELQHASVFVNPSFIESYSLVVAEAMSVGTPSVVSFAGAMPELAEHNKEALFYNPMDYKQCAFEINKILTDKNLAFRLSRNAVIRSHKREIENDIVQQQLHIYSNILKATF